MKRSTLLHGLLLGVIGGVIAFATTGVVQKDQKRYVRMDHAVHQTLAGIPSEQTLVDFCYRLRTVRGVTGVSYRDYSNQGRTAVLTVFYNPQQTSVRQLRILMSYPYILWEKPLAS